MFTACNRLFHTTNQDFSRKKPSLEVTYTGSGLTQACKAEHGSPSKDRSVHAALSAKVSLQ